VCALLLSASCSRFTPRKLSYLLEVSRAIPREMTVTIRLQGWNGPSLDLRGHAPSEVMHVDRLEVVSGDGRRLRWIERAESTRVKGTSLHLSTFRVSGPIPPVLEVRYQVTPGRREGDAHIGFTGKCFGYLGPDFGVVTGRDVFLLPEKAESLGPIEVAFSLPEGWTAATPWRSGRGRWIVDAPRGNAAEHLVASTVGLGRFHERSLFAGRHRVRVAFPEAVRDESSDVTANGIRQAVSYLRGIFGRDLGSQYFVVAAPETPDGFDIAGGGWATGQGGTLVPLSVERLRGFAEEYIQSYVRYPPYRTEIRRPEEFWLVDAVPRLYSRRTVWAAGLGDEEGIDRLLATSYLTAITTEGVNRDLEHLYVADGGDRIARESIAPYMLRHLDHELKAKHGVARGMDSILPKLFSGRFAPSVWSLLPRTTGEDWDTFRARFVRGARVAPVPELFTLTPTQELPSPRGGSPVSRLTIAYTGNTDGYLENCGCKANESGGIARRATVLDSLRRADPDLLVLDAGSAFNRPEPFESPNALAKREQRFYLEMMDRMGYSAATVGQGEIARGPRYFLEQTRGVRTPFLGANLSVGGNRLGASTATLRARGIRVLTVGVFEGPRGGRSMIRLDQELARLTTEDPVQAIQKEVARARSPTGLVVAMGKISPATIRRIVRTCPDVDVIISTDNSAPQWADPSNPKVILEEDRPGFLDKTLVLYTKLGQYGLSIATLDLDRAGQIVAATIRDSWLTDSIPDQDVVRRAMNRFYDQVGALPEAQASVRPPLSGDPYWQGKRYAGSGTCRGCHVAEYEQWMSTGHAGAYKTLLQRHRHYQPVCISCHVVGYGSKYGYVMGQGEHPYGNVQCEICHGPGAEHASAPSPSNIRRKVPEQVCLECHNPEHSSGFVYAQRLPLVVHRSREQVTSR